MSQITDKMCVICRVEFDTECLPEPTTKLTSKGIQTLMEYSELRGNTELTEYLSNDSNVVIAHIDCRKEYTNKKSYESLKRQADECKPVIPPKGSSFSLC